MSSKSASPWISIKLGRALNGIDIHVPPCPSSNAEIHEKARAFDGVAQAISAHLDVFEFAELKTCLGSQIPGSHAFSASQVQQLDTALAKAPFRVENLSPIGFLLDDKSPVDPAVAQAPGNRRPANIRYFRVSFRVDPQPFALPGTSLTDIEPFIAEYDIPLFQTPVQQAGGLPRLNIWPNNTPGPQQTPHAGPPAAETVPTVPRLLGHTVQSLVHYALPTVFAAPTPLPPAPVETPQTYGPAQHGPPTAPAHGQTQPGSLINTYVGNLEFLTNQTLLDEHCKCRPVFMPTVSAGWTTFCKQVKWTVFAQLVRIAYVGNLATDHAKSIRNIAVEFQKLSMVDHSPKTEYEFDNPDSLFDAYVERLSSLPTDTHTWGFCLPHLYFAALSDECREHLTEYKCPDVSMLTTKNAHYEALTVVRAEAATAFKTLSRNNTTMKRFFTQHFNKSSIKAFTSTVAGAVSPSRSPHRKKGRNVSWSSDNNASSDQVNSFAFLSPAEQTLQKHKQSDSTDVKEFPTDPFTGYVSKYYRGQKCCYGCGECDPSKHIEFKFCPKRTEEETKQTFYKELHAHSKSSRDKWQLTKLARQQNPDKANSDKAKQATPATSNTAPPSSIAPSYQAQLMPPPSHVHNSHHSRTSLSPNVYLHHAPNLSSLHARPTAHARYFTSAPSTFCPSL